MSRTSFHDQRDATNIYRATRRTFTSKPVHQHPPPKSLKVPFHSPTSLNNVQHAIQHPPHRLGRLRFCRNLCSERRYGLRYSRYPSFEVRRQGMPNTRPSSDLLFSSSSAANLTSLAGAAQAVANTTEGAAFLAALPGSNKTLFAPINEVSRRTQHEARVSLNVSLQGLCRCTRVRFQQCDLVGQHLVVSITVA
jgi:hypothetical protein